MSSKLFLSPPLSPFSSRKRNFSTVWKLPLFQVYDHWHDHWVFYQLYKISWCSFDFPSFQNPLAFLNLWLHALFYYFFPAFIWIFSLLKIFYFTFSDGKESRCVSDSYLNSITFSYFLCSLRSFILCLPPCVGTSVFFFFFCIVHLEIIKLH